LKRAFGDDNLGRTQTYDCYKRFKNGGTSTDDDDRSGWPSTGNAPENVAKVRDLILQDRRLTIQDLYNTLGLSYGTYQQFCWRKLPEKRGTMTGYTTMTTHDPIRLRFCGNFWLKTRWHPTPPTVLVRLSSMLLLSLPQDENEVEGAKI
jgi:hypothetical protein